MVCPPDWFPSGSSCYQENGKDTWEGAKEGCTKSGGNLVKINNSSKHKVFTRFLEISGAKEAQIDVSTRYLLHLSPGVKIIKRNDMLTHLLSVSRCCALFY